MENVRYKTYQEGRRFLVKIRPGESLVANIKQIAVQEEIHNAVILSAIGFPTTMFTALFALARTVGWIAQWAEMIEDPAQKIGRPRQIYTGATERPYTMLNKR